MLAEPTALPYQSQALLALGEDVDQQLSMRKPGVAHGILRAGVLVDPLDPGTRTSGHASQCLADTAERTAARSGDCQSTVTSSLL